MFTYTVEGQYVQGGKLAQISFYSTTITMEEGDEGIARSIIHNVLLTPKLQKELENFKKWRTAQIVKKEPAKQSKTDIDPELEKATKEAVNLGAIPANLQQFATDEDKTKVLNENIEKAKTARAAAQKKRKQKIVDEGYVD